MTRVGKGPNQVPRNQSRSPSQGGKELAPAAHEVCKARMDSAAEADPRMDSAAEAGPGAGTLMWEVTSQAVPSPQV